LEEFFGRHARTPDFDVIASERSERGNLPFNRSISSSSFCCLSGDCFVAHLPRRAVPGTNAPRNDIMNFYKDDSRAKKVPEVE
jgi:hypothetical protein